MICIVVDCKIKAYARSYCHKHLKRWQRHGDPNIVLHTHRFKVGPDPKRYDLAHANTTHGMKNTPTYTSWCAMKQRCTNSKRPSYNYYGGRGITYCERWKDFNNFLADMGVRPEGTSLDRIDSNGNYEPDNCRWATYKVQARNSGRHKVVT